MELNARNIEKAKPGDTLRDRTTQGLHLRVFADRQSFYLYYRTKTRVERRPKLGDYPMMSLPLARERARELLLEVAAGRDPMYDRERATAAPMFADLCDKYLRDYATRKKSEREDKRMVGVLKGTKLAKRKVSEIEHEDVAKLHSSMAETPTQANRYLALLSKMFNLAELWRMRPPHTNPCRHVQRYREEKRRRKMTTGEAAAIAQALGEHAETAKEAVAFIYLLILSGARKGEIAAIQPEWLEGNVLRLPDSKTGERFIFLPPQAMVIIEKLPRVAGQTLLRIKDPTNTWKMVRTKAGCPDLRLHDLRRSFASVALSMGLTLSQIGELLGHASAQTTKGYAYLMTDPHLAAAEMVAGKLEEMMSGGQVHKVADALDAHASAHVGVQTGDVR